MCRLANPVGEYSDYPQREVLTITKQCEQSEISAPSRTPIEDSTGIGFPPSKLQHSVDLCVKLFTFLWKSVKSLNAAECSQ